MTRRAKIRSLKVTLSLVTIMFWAGHAIAGDKTAICHYSEEDNVWNYLSVGAKAAIAHIDHHDDAVPGGYTAASGTQLDDVCEVVVQCPCDFDLSTATKANWSGRTNYITRPGGPSGYGCFADFNDGETEISVDSLNGYCLLIIDAEVIIFSNIDTSASAEAIQCAKDLDAYMAALETNGVTINRDLVNGEDEYCAVGVANNP